ncbi:MAG TPA: HNH endonuclease [Bacteroidetes bacterium]|nr:HNH endonuclease [Bacteroidota bacterium]
MKKGQRLWTRDELILALNLYYTTPFGRLHKGNPDIINLSKLINRTPSSVTYKLVNFASLDPTLIKRGIKGASNASKLDKIVWDEFYGDWEKAIFESEKMRANLEGISIKDIIEKKDFKLKKGIEKDVTVKQRVNQSFFRKMILASYNGTCCITGMKIRELLIAGHIKPWSVDSENRLNPRNGIAINSLHDKAFEVGLISIDTNFKIKIAKKLLASKDSKIEQYFKKYHDKEIILPSKFLPDEQFLAYHFNEKFRG